jgi:NADPH-dependent 2,4-dienoyl-CoA reductase/sulfur reductase-like enzyme
LESKNAPRVGILGGGFIELELASALSETCQVDLFEAQENLLSRVLPKEISDRVAARHAEAGVNIHMSAKITGVEGNSERVQLTLADGQVFESDLVVLGVGAIPNDELASKRV